MEIAMKKITVEASTPYDVLIEKGLIDQAGERSLPVTGRVRATIVSDDTVFSLYGRRLTDSLKKVGYDVAAPFVVPHGEASKSMENFSRLTTHLAEIQFTRADVIFALGGGVVGDLAGFAAACWLRGVRFIQIPTTLLACVDSSVGGKTAVNIPAGKNLVGAFHQPSLVLCDPETLDSLPAETFACGMAEVVKYGMIDDRDLFELLLSPARPQENMETIIARCVADKGALVKRDEFDTGARQLLNLGHTVGHGVETLSHFTVAHGEAVAIGMAIMTRAARARGLCPAADCEALLALLQRNGLPVTTDYTAEALYHAALSDKKRKGGAITLVVPHGVADSRLFSCPVEELLNFIKAGL